MTRRKQHSNPVINNRFRFEGKTYRVATQYGRILLIAVKRRPGGKGERLLKYDGRRWRQVAIYFRSQTWLDTVKQEIAA